MSGVEPPLEVSLRHTSFMDACPGDHPTPLLNSKSCDCHDKFGTGTLVSREGSAALDRRRGRLYELVCANGPRSRPARKRSSVGADAFPEELDPGALRRARAVVLAGRDTGRAP